MRMNAYLLIIFFILLFNFSLWSENPYVKIIYPNGNEIIKTGSIVKITWKTNIKDSKVLILLYKKGILIRKIGIHIDNKGFYFWKVPKSLKDSKFYRIRIRLESNLLINDFSDKNFEINHLPPLPQ